MKNISSEDEFYFVHSFFMEPNDPNLVLNETTYIDKFCSGIEKENISLIGTIITFLIFVISLPKWFEVRWKLNNVWKLVGIKKTNRNGKSSFYFLKGLLGSILL